MLSNLLYASSQFAYMIFGNNLIFIKVYFYFQSTSKVMYKE